MLGLKEAAKETLRTVLIYSPGLVQIRQTLSAIEEGNQSCSARPASNRN
jgi:hypothetical protein